MTEVHLVIKTEKETFTVHLGPLSFLPEKKATFNEGDVVEIVGWKANMFDRPFVIARAGFRRRREFFAFSLFCPP